MKDTITLQYIRTPGSKRVIYTEESTKMQLHEGLLKSKPSNELKKIVF